MKMKKCWNSLCIFLLVLAVFLTGCSSANTSKNVLKAESNTIVFADKKQAVDILSKEDEYIKGFSKFDYESKMKSMEPLNLEQRKEFYSKAVLTWEESGKRKIEEAIQGIDTKIKELNLRLPSEIIFIITDGSEEGGAAYTRENAIILPQNMISASSAKGLQFLIAHELFHVYSRYNKDLRDKIYGIIHFNRCEEFEFPTEIKDFKISNPDAPENNYYIDATYKGKIYSFIPIIYSSKPYDIKSKEPFFKSLEEKMVAVNIVNSKPEVIVENGKPLIVNKNEIEDFYKRIGENTKYTYHPEETMAENFAILVSGADVQSQWVIDDLKKVISR